MARHTRTPIRAGERSCRTSIMDTTKGRAWFVGRSVAKGNWVASVVQPHDLVAQWNAGQGAMLYSKMEPATLHYTKNIICHVCGSAEISFAIPSGSEPTCLFRSCSDCASTNIFAHAADSVAPCRTQRTCRTFLGQTSCRLNVRMRHARGLASSLAHLSTHFRPHGLAKTTSKTTATCQSASGTMRSLCGLLLAFVVDSAASQSAGPFTLQLRPEYSFTWCAGASFTGNNSSGLKSAGLRRGQGGAGAAETSRFAGALRMGASRRP